MEKKPLNFVVKDAREAAKRLNEIVEKGGFNFDFGINEEYVTTVSKNSDGSTDKTKEKRFRLVGFVDMYVGEELAPLDAVRKDLKEVQEERKEMNRILNIMHKSSFAPMSIFLLLVAIFTLTFGILTIAKILPLPGDQLPIAIILVIIGALALGGSIALFILRRNKKLHLLSEEDEILRKDEELKNKEMEIDSRVPSWYKEALWRNEGSELRNASQHFILK